MEMKIQFDINGLFTPSERERESDVANIWTVFFSIQLFTPSDAKDQRKNRFSFFRSLGVNGPLFLQISQEVENLVN